MPISDCEVRDPRIRRTRQLLQNALGDLLRSKNLDELSVQDITEAATLNRATFYDHYTDKFDLFRAMVAGGFHGMLHERGVRFDGKCPAAVLSLILTACDYLTSAHADSDGCNRHSAFQPLMDAAIAAAIRRILMDGMRGNVHLGSPGVAPELTASAASWAIYGAVKEWFDTPGHAPAHEIAPVIFAMVFPMIEGKK